MEETHVVTCFLRNRGDVLLLRRSDAVGSYAGQWGAVAGHATERGESDPDRAARREIAEETGLADAVTLVRRGASFPVEDTDLGARWIVQPLLFDCDRRDVATNEETSEYEWVPPTEILRRETVPRLWTSYDRVRPTVETIGADRDHGAAYISIRALEHLRDEAALAVERERGGWNSLARLARELLAGRPTMTVVANRINRVMATVEEQTPAAVERTATEEIERALAADDAAAATAGERLAGARILTLSRSGTVRAALRQADPEAVVIAESRPGGEGVGVAESLAAEMDVGLVPDAGLAWAMAQQEYDAVLVGADTIRADGSLVNKVGTRMAALAARHEGIPVYAVAASDKISPDTDTRLETGDPRDLYGGDADIEVSVPLFDVTPATLIDGIITENGLLDTAGVQALATEHRTRSAWQD